MSLLCLDENVLLHVFSYLNLIDSINFADTCIRLRQVGTMANIKYKKFDLHAYLDHSDVKKKRLPPKKILSRIGLYVADLSTRFNLHNKCVMENCINIKSLHIYSRSFPYNTSETHPSIWNSWIKKLKLERLSLRDHLNFNELLDGVTNLKKLKLECELPSIDTYNFLAQNSTMENLCIPLNTNFNYDIFGKLENLRFLRINMISSINDLTKLKVLLKMDGLIKFGIIGHIRTKQELNCFNLFLNSLAEKTKLDKLQLTLFGRRNIDRNTFRALKSFNLSSLTLFCFFTWGDVTNFITENSSPNLKKLALAKDEHCSFHLIAVMVKNWKKLEELNVSLDEDELQRLLDKVRIDEILKISTNRSPLMLNIYCVEDGVIKSIVKIKFDFNSQQHKVFNGNENEDLSDISLGIHN